MSRVLVRRARRGAAPFVWEITKDTMSEPVFISPEAFVTMEAAFVAGSPNSPSLRRRNLDAQPIESHF